MTVQYQSGLERLLASSDAQRPLRDRRLGLVAHPASVTRDLRHALDALSSLSGFQVTAAFGPQHGLRGDKQDNMIESDDDFDATLGIPVFSLYGKIRRPTPEMLDHCDVLLVDLQDLGCRIYTFLTTLRYILETAADCGKSVIVLDRPNPVGRPIEGYLLRPGWESFVGAGPLPMRHGMTPGELATWWVDSLGIDCDLQIIPLQGWDPGSSPGFGWPVGFCSWVNPSPNATCLAMARCYPGSVLFEGTTLSEGRGTTRPLECFGAPDLDIPRLLREMQRLAPRWLQGCRLRPCWFEPTFHKYTGRLCAGLQVHVEDPDHYHHGLFQPWRLHALVLKAIRLLWPDYPLWRDFPYEYEFEKLAIDVINGGPELREWVDDPSAVPADLDALCRPDELQWEEERTPWLRYP